MKIQKTEVIQAALIFELVLPVISLITYLYLHIFFNFNNYYIITNVVVLLIFASSINRISRNSYYFLLLFLSILFLNLLAYIFYSGFISGCTAFFKTISRYYIFIFLGYILYRYYYKPGKEDAILRLVVYFSLFIAIINCLHFLVLVTDAIVIDGYKITFNRYRDIYYFIKEINPKLADYIILGYKYDNIFKPPGFFFDTHSQFYMPIGASIILLFKQLGFKYKRLLIGFLLLSVLISGVKTAYMIILILGVIYFITNLDGKYFLKYLRIILISLILIFLVIGNYILLIFGGESLYKIASQLWGHFFEIPVKLIRYELVAFLAGGAPFLRGLKFYYSEVFLVTALIYIGLCGLLLYFTPIVLLKKIKTMKLPAYIYLSFILSLSHYSVYMIGINNLFSALSFMYFFAYINNEISMESNAAS